MNSSLSKQMFGQYCIALLLGGLVLTCLYLTPEGRVSLTLPDGSIACHPWNGSDTMTYVNPARSFIEKGIFERNGIPDMHRTIGYPFLLSGMMVLFGAYWVPVAYVFQLVVGALLFPAILYIMDSLGICGKKTVVRVCMFMLLLGIHLAYVGQILTDQFFTSLLYAGIACGFYAIRQKSWKAALLHVVLIGYAAQVRPTLGLFFLVDFFFLAHVVSISGAGVASAQKKMIVFMVLLSAISGNAAAARNYYNHGVFTPTSILADNLARYLAGPVMIAEGLSVEYGKKVNEIKLLVGKKKIEVQKEFAFSIYREFPLTTVRRLVYHGMWNLFEPHWEYILKVYGSGFALNSFYGEDGTLQKSLLYNIPFTLFYICLYILFCLALLRRHKEKHYFLLFGIIIFLLPFGASFINGQGARMRLFAEPLILMISCGYLSGHRAKYLLSLKQNMVQKAI